MFGINGTIYGYMESSSEEILTPKRAPRKRAPAKRVGIDGEIKPRAPRKTATTPRKRVARKKVEETEETVTERITERVTEPVVSEKVRKAPTSFASEQQATKRFRKQMMVVAVVLITGIGTSAAVGFTDKGQIDVQKTIEDRNERIRNNTATEQDTIASKVEVPVQDTTAAAKENKADGGLIGRGTGGSVPKPRAELATPNASTTESMASSTEAVASSTEATGAEDAGNESITETNEVESATVPEPVTE